MQSLFLEGQGAPVQSNVIQNKVKGKTMRLFLAIYDPASQTDYWVHRHDVIPKKILDSFYYGIVRYKPDNIEKFGWEDIYAGLATIDKTWCCWYRFMAAGRDTFGRPGRFIIVTAFFYRDGPLTHQTEKILESPIFRNLAQIAPQTYPIPRPESLEFELDSPCIELSQNIYNNPTLSNSTPDISNASPSTLSNTNPVCFYGENSFIQATTLIADSFQTRDLFVVMERYQNQMQAQIHFSTPADTKKTESKLTQDKPLDVIRQEKPLGATIRQEKPLDEIHPTQSYFSTDQKQIKKVSYIFSMIGKPVNKYIFFLLILLVALYWMYNYNISQNISDPPQPNIQNHSTQQYGQRQEMANNPKKNNQDDSTWQISLPFILPQDDPPKLEGHQENLPLQSNFSLAPEQFRECPKCKKKSWIIKKTGNSITLEKIRMVYYSQDNTIEIRCSCGNTVAKIILLNKE